MKTALKNNSWITTIAFALIEFPIIIFLSYFSIGSKDDVMEIYHSDPSRIIFIKGCISFVITSFLMSLIMLLYVIIKRILLNVRVTRKKISTCTVEHPLSACHPIAYFPLSNPSFHFSVDYCCSNNSKCSASLS